MKIFETSTDAQEFIVTPRNTTTYYMLHVCNEDTKEITKYYTETGVLPPTAKRMTTDVLNTVSLTIGFDFEAVNNQSYELTLFLFGDGFNDKVLWRGKAFATSQDTQKYKINV